MSVKFTIMSFNRKYLFGFLALSFLLTVALPDVSLSQESQAGKQNVLRQASLEWMQVGIKQYQSNQFVDAERSFRRALVFKKYLTEAERLKINNFLTNARTAISEGKQAVASTKTDDKPAEPIQPVKAEVKVKDSESVTAKAQQQTEKEPEIINSPIEQKVQPVKPAEPDVPKIQLAAESPQDEVIIVKDNSFRSNLMRLSDWLSLNRRNVFMIGLPVLAVLVIILKLQTIRRRPGRRVYANYVPANSSFIGNRLASSNETNRPGKGSKKGRLTFAAVAKPERKSFEQSTEHWNKEPAGLNPSAGKPSRTNKKWPQRKDKPKAGDSTVTKAEQKQCRKCEETKAHTDFHKNKSSKDGLASWCKDCKKEYRKQRAAEKK